MRLTIMSIVIKKKSINGDKKRIIPSGEFSLSKKI